MMLDSAIRTDSYSIVYDTVATPVMSPVGNTYNTDQSVAITCATIGRHDSLYDRRQLADRRIISLFNPDFRFR